MYSDVRIYADNCPQCAIVEVTDRKQKPQLQPILMERPFQILGVDIMELPVTSRGNKYVIVFQDLFTKWPMVYPAPDQKTEHIAWKKLYLVLVYQRLSCPIDKPICYLS